MLLRRPHKQGRENARTADALGKFLEAGILEDAAGVGGGFGEDGEGKVAVFSCSVRVQPHVLPPGLDVEVYEALVCRLCRVAESEEILSHVAVNYGAERGSQLAAERAGVERRELALNGLADIPLGWVRHRLECLNLELTFAIWGRKIEAELPSETLGTRDLTDTAMLIPFTTDFHPATLQGAEDVTTVSTMVFCGVCESHKAQQTIVNEYVAGVVQWQNVSFPS